MIGAAFALLGALAAGVRAVYPRVMERRSARRRTLGPDGIVAGGSAIEHERSGAPGVLLIHGGGDTPQVLAELATHLHARGFSVSVPLLAGHGRSLSDFAKVSSATWHQQVAEEFSRLRRANTPVAVVGLSMGGALALDLASGRSDVRALVLLAPYVDMPGAVKRVAATAKYWGWLLPYFPSGGGRSVRDPEAAARTLGHGIFTPSALGALFDVMTDATEALPRVTSPTLVVQSKEDNRIASASTERAFAQLGSAEKKLVWTTGAGHVITVDYGREAVFELVTDWIETHMSDKEPVRVRTDPSPRIK